jgi:hypothetical protein
LAVGHSRHKTAPDSLQNKGVVEMLRKRLCVCKRVLELIERRRAESGIMAIGRAIEELIISRELSELEPPKEIGERSTKHHSMTEGPEDRSP